PEHEQLAIGGLTTVKDVYTADFTPKQLEEDEQARVMGLQGQLWTEYMPTAAHVQYMAFPRMCALAARACGSPEQSWEQLEERRAGHGQGPLHRRLHPQAARGGRAGAGDGSARPAMDGVHAHGRPRAVHGLPTHVRPGRARLGFARAELGGVRGAAARPSAAPGRLRHPLPPAGLRWPSPPEPTRTAARPTTCVAGSSAPGAPGG